MGINIEQVILDWNEEQINAYEKLNHYTNKTSLKNKHINKIKQHIEARNNLGLLIELYSESNYMNFLRELKRCRIIKRLS